MSKHIRKGSSILEVVVATALISMGVISALSLTNYSQKQSNYSKYFNEATTYNSQAADWLRGQKSTLGWAVFANTIGAGKTYCLKSLTTLAGSQTGSCTTSDVIPTTQFRREIVITNNGLGKVTAVLTTKWEEKTTRTVTLTTEIGQWQ